MSQAIIVQVTLYDEESGQVSEQIAARYDSSYGWEIERSFEMLGALIAKKVDPNHE